MTDGDGRFLVNAPDERAIRRARFGARPRRRTARAGRHGSRSGPRHTHPGNQPPSASPWWSRPRRSRCRSRRPRPASPSSPRASFRLDRSTPWPTRCVRCPGWRRGDRRARRGHRRVSPRRRVELHAGLRGRRAGERVRRGLRLRAPVHGECRADRNRPRTAERALRLERHRRGRPRRDAPRRARVRRGERRGWQLRDVARDGGGSGGLGAWTWGASAERVASDGFNGEETAAGVVRNDDYARHALSGTAGGASDGGAGVRGHVSFGRDDRGSPGPVRQQPDRRVRRDRRRVARGARPVDGRAHGCRCRSPRASAPRRRSASAASPATSPAPSARPSRHRAG
jgi:hypothetical protein